MRPTSLAVAAAALVVAAIVAGATVGSLGTVVAYGAGALVLVGTTFGRLRLAIVPLAIGGILAVIAALAPSGDTSDDWNALVPMLLVIAGIGASLCVALGALVRRVGRLVAEGSDGSR